MEVEFELDTLLAVESNNDPENIIVLARGDLRTSFTINIIANVTGRMAGMWSVLHIIATYIVYLNRASCVANVLCIVILILKAHSVVCKTPYLVCQVLTIRTCTCMSLINAYSVLSMLPSLVHSVQMFLTLTQKTLSRLMLGKPLHLSHSMLSATLLKKGMKLLY